MSMLFYFCLTYFSTSALAMTCTKQLSANGGSCFYFMTSNSNKALVKALPGRGCPQHIQDQFCRENPSAMSYACCDFDFCVDKILNVTLKPTPHICTGKQLVKCKLPDIAIFFYGFSCYEATTYEGKKVYGFSGAVCKDWIKATRCTDNMVWQKVKCCHTNDCNDPKSANYGRKDKRDIYYDCNAASAVFVKAFNVTVAVVLVFSVFSYL